MKLLIPILAFTAFAATLVSCHAQTKKKATTDTSISLTPPAGKAIAAFAEGCFWCGENIFESVLGVDSVVSGYAGGNVPNPTYELVSTETTGHAESLLVYYDPKIVSYAELLKVFFSSQDPTTLDQQGPDRGNSYRSIIFYQSKEEQALAKQAKKDFASSFSDPIVSEIKPLTAFYRAEEYHQDFAKKNPNYGYIQGISIPREKLFQKTYKGKLKKD
jgi:peptide-methionine (S)-S-oxide reductase